MDERSKGSAGGGVWHRSRADPGSVSTLVPQQRPGEGCVKLKHTVKTIGKSHWTVLCPVAGGPGHQENPHAVGLVHIFRLLHTCCWLCWCWWSLYPGPGLHGSSELESRQGRCPLCLSGEAQTDLQIEVGPQAPVAAMVGRAWDVFQPMLFGLIGAEITISKLNPNTVGEDCTCQKQKHMTKKKRL